jgi:alginate O-acetyltransferase complex protein AlgI
MVFSSHIFVYYFLPVLLAVYYLLYRAPQRWRNCSLVVLGYVFYGWANPKFMFLMFGTTFVDWLLSLIIAWDSWRVWRAWGKPIAPLGKGTPHSGRQRAAIAASVVSNLTMLGFFKYFNFGVESYNALCAALGLGAWQWDTFFRVVLPLGISFYTFQSLSYIIDVYRGDAKAMRNFIDFSCFVSMCPHLVAGPILKFSYLAGQLEHRALTLDKFARGVAFFALGMAKKILLANPCGKIADTAFNAAAVNTPDAWLGVLGYSFQIYFDFSGYSDMAIGLGLMLGFVFAKNFDSPYRSQSISEFWRRWHISLSTWLREYLYIPLGGNRLGKLRTYLNLMLTMLLGGLWHGAAWNFLAWGGIHGGMLALERAQGKDSFYRALPRVFRVAVTFLTVTIAWVFFRAADLPAAVAYLASMAGRAPAPPAAALLGGTLYQPYYVACFLTAGAVVWLCPSTWDFTQRLSLPKAAVCLLLLWASLVVLATQEYNPFIYFIF